MSTTIPLRDLRNHNAQIIERVRAGESFVVTRDGVPVADVTPHVVRSGPPTFRLTSELGDFLDTGLSREHAEAWLRDIRDAPFDDEPRDPWERR